MDQLALHPYPNPGSPTDAPNVGYPSRQRYGISNLSRVKQAVWDAFHSTAQPTTLEGLTFRIDEVGWQGRHEGPAGLRQLGERGHRRRGDASSAPGRMVQEYFACDPAVTDVLLFLLVDEPYRNGRDAKASPWWRLAERPRDGGRPQREAYRTMGQLAAKGRRLHHAPDRLVSEAQASPLRDAGAWGMEDGRDGDARGQ